MIRHLFVTNDFPPKTGGIESYLVALCAGLDPESVTVVAPRRAGDEAVDAALPYRVVRLPRRYLRASARVRKDLVRVATETGADVVHFLHALPLGRLARRVRRETGCPVTVFAHGSEVLVPSRMPLVRGTLRRVLAGADRVITVSRYTAEAVERVTKGRATVEVVEPAVDVERFSLAVSGARVRDRHGLGSRFTVLFVARLVKRKGAEALIRAMPGLPDATALVVGSGPEEAALRRLVDELEIGDRVVLAGFVPDEELPEYYAGADVFCMPCTDRYGGVDTEGYGVVYLEAAACGLPSVAGRCGGSAEAVEDGRTGVVLDDPTPTALAKTLRRLQEDEGWRTRLGAQGRMKAEEQSPAGQAEKLEAAVRPLVTGPATRSS